MIRGIAFAGLLLLSGCGLPVAVVTGALGVTAGVLRLDNTLLDAWLATKGEQRVPTAATPAPTKD